MSVNYHRRANVFIVAKAIIHLITATSSAGLVGNQVTQPRCAATLQAMQTTGQTWWIKSNTSVTEADELPLVNIQVVKKQPSEPSMTVEPVKLDSGAPFHLYPRQHS